MQFVIAVHKTPGPGDWSVNCPASPANFSLSLLVNKHLAQTRDKLKFAGHRLADTKRPAVVTDERQAFRFPLYFNCCAVSRAAPR